MYRLNAPIAQGKLLSEVEDNILSTFTILACTIIKSQNLVNRTRKISQSTLEDFDEK